MARLGRAYPARVWISKAPLVAGGSASFNLVGAAATAAFGSFVSGVSYTFSGVSATAAVGSFVPKDDLTLSSCLLPARSARSPLSAVPRSASSASLRQVPSARLRQRSMLRFPASLRLAQLAALFLARASASLACPALVPLVRSLLKLMLLSPASLLLVLLATLLLQSPSPLILWASLLLEALVRSPSKATPHSTSSASLATAAVGIFAPKLISPSPASLPLALLELSDLKQTIWQVAFPRPGRSVPSSLYSCYVFRRLCHWRCWGLRACNCRQRHL